MPDSQKEATPDSQKKSIFSKFFLVGGLISLIILGSMGVAIFILLSKDLTKINVERIQMYNHLVANKFKERIWEYKGALSSITNLFEARIFEQRSPSSEGPSAEFMQYYLSREPAIDFLYVEMLNEPTIPNGENIRFLLSRDTFPGKVGDKISINYYISKTDEELQDIVFNTLTEASEKSDEIPFLLSNVYETQLGPTVTSLSYPIHSKKGDIIGYAEAMMNLETINKEFALFHVDNFTSEGIILIDADGNLAVSNSKSYSELFGKPIAESELTQPEIDFLLGEESGILEATSPTLGPLFGYVQKIDFTGTGDMWTLYTFQKTTKAPIANSNYLLWAILLISLAAVLLLFIILTFWVRSLSLDRSKES